MAMRTVAAVAVAVLWTILLELPTAAAANDAGHCVELELVHVSQDVDATPSYGGSVSIRPPWYTPVHLANRPELAKRGDTWRVDSRQSRLGFRGPGVYDFSTGVNHEAATVEPWRRGQLLGFELTGDGRFDDVLVGVQPCVAVDHPGMWDWWSRSATP